MRKKISFRIDEKFAEEIRSIQAEKISKSRKAVPFSQVLNEIIEEGIKSFNQNVDTDRLEIVYNTINARNRSKEKN